MSYDLRLIAVPDGVEVKAAYVQLVQREEAEVGDLDDWVKRPLPVSTRAQMKQLADMLRARWAAFVQFEPKSPMPWIELNDEDLQIQVSVYEDSVSITMPYFRQRTCEMIDCLNCCIQVCREHRGYAAFDPQLDRAVTVNDSESITRAYRQMDEALRRLESARRRLFLPKRHRPGAATLASWASRKLCAGSRRRRT